MAEKRMTMQEKRNNQRWINEQCECAIDLVEMLTNDRMIDKWLPLYHCQAAYTVLETRTGIVAYVLRSYKTIVCIAFYDPDFGKLIIYDILRKVYGYTATSAQHIAKFRNLLLRMLNLNHGEIDNYMWRAIE